MSKLASQLREVPPPSDVYYNYDLGGFYSIEARSSMGDEFNAAWVSRRYEFPWKGGCEGVGHQNPREFKPIQPESPTKMELLVTAMVPTMAEQFIKENWSYLGAYPEWEEGVVMEAVKFAEIIVEACKGR